MVLAVTRDNELSVIDMRQMLVQKKLSDPEFRVAADYTRCTFSVSFSVKYLFQKIMILTIYSIQKNMCVNIIFVFETDTTIFTILFVFLILKINLSLAGASR